MRFTRARAAVGAALATGAVASGIVLTSGGGPSSVDVTWSKNQCESALFCKTLNGSFDLDVVRVIVDCHGTCRTNALRFATGATGRINRLDILTQGEDGIKFQNGTDIVVDGGVVRSDARVSTSHQDCLQAFGGRHVRFNHVIFACATANNAQWYMDGLAGTGPVDFVCDGCEFHPGAGFHDVTIGLSDSSGVRNSLVCPAASQGLQFSVLATAVNPVDVNNVKPWPATADPRCVTTPGTPPVTTTVQATTSSATTTAPTTTQATTTTAPPPATAAELVAAGFVILRGQATLYASWKAANPGEAAKLDAYLLNGGTPPVLVTATGRTLVKFAEAGFLP